jgi:hypothetical protein
MPIEVGRRQTAAMLRLDTHDLGDSWIAADDENHHLDVPQHRARSADPAPPRARSVGQAVSASLTDWDYRGTCLGPAAAGFDDLDDEGYCAGR